MDRDNDLVNTQLEEENRYLKSLVIKGEEFADEMYEELLKCYDCFVKVENEIDDEECLGAIFDILEHQTAIEDKLMDITVLRNEIKHEQGDFLRIEGDEYIISARLSFTYPQYNSIQTPYLFYYFTFINFLGIAPACSLCDITSYVRFRNDYNIHTCIRYLY